MCISAYAGALQGVVHAGSRITPVRPSSLRGVRKHRPPARSQLCTSRIRAGASASLGALDKGRGGPDDSSVAPATDNEKAQAPEDGSRQTHTSVAQRVKNFFLADRIDRKRLAALGLGAVASYGFVSNATYGTGLAVSWVAFVKQYGLSPLAPQQWQKFLAFYAGFWTLQHFLRPFRFSLALGLAPAFDKFITKLQTATGFNRRNAFGVFLFILGSTTSLLVFGSIFIFCGPVAFARRV